MTQATAMKDLTPKTMLKQGKEEWEGPAILGELAEKGYDLKFEIDALKKMQAEIHEKLIKEVEALNLDGAVNIVSGPVKCTVSPKDKVEITNPDGLRETLGERWEDLVNEKTTLAPVKKLVDIALDADDPLSDAVRACLSVKPRKPYIKYALKA